MRHLECCFTACYQQKGLHFISFLFIYLFKLCQVYHSYKHFGYNVSPLWKNLVP